VAIKTHSSHRNAELFCAAPEFACFFNSILKSADESEDAAARRTSDREVIIDTVSVALATVRTRKNLE
jgi:hypothetical protein